jgi:hypothetical protein
MELRDEPLNLKEEVDLTYGYELRKDPAAWKLELTNQNLDSIAFGTAMWDVLSI